MKKAAVVVISLFALFISVKAAAFDDCADPVTTETGMVSGHDSENWEACAWKGIPYATPPVGDLRWTSPVPAPKWEGVMDAGSFGPACFQSTGDEAEMSEDCLYLNIWRPKKSGIFPVMVWIHGGGYVMGSGGSGSIGLGYNGANMASYNDVVVVTLNYRLHALGFMAHPKLREEDANNSTGSYGSLDQARAIEWVHDNIESFGGDPAKVAIFGESAGGWSVCTMLATPLNSGRISGAILQSGGCTKSSPLEQGYEQTRSLAERVGCDYDDIDCLRSVPPEKLTGGVLLLYKEGMSWEPHHDGYLLTDTPLEMIRAGNYNKVPFVAGSTRNETDAVLRFRPALWHALPFQYKWKLRRHLDLTKDEADRLVELYPREDFGWLPRHGYGRIMTDAGLACHTYLGVAAVAEHQNNVWYYRYDFDDFKYGKTLGALHSMDVPLTFGNLGEGMYPGEKMALARDLSRLIQDYWTNVAKDGDPNDEELPDWPRFTEESQKRIILDNEISVEAADMEERCAFWEEYFEDHTGLEETLLGSD